MIEIPAASLIVLSRLSKISSQVIVSTVLLSPACPIHCRMYIPRQASAGLSMSRAGS